MGSWGAYAPKKINVSSKIRIQNFFGTNRSWVKKMWVQKVVGSRNILGAIFFFWNKNILDNKKIYFQENVVQKILGPERFGYKEVGTKKISLKNWKK